MGSTWIHDGGGKKCKNCRPQWHMDSDQKKNKTLISSSSWWFCRFPCNLSQYPLWVLWEMMSLFTLLHCMVVNVLCNSHGTAKRLREGKIKQWSITCIYIASVLISAELNWTVHAKGTVSHSAVLPGSFWHINCENTTYPVLFLHHHYAVHAKAYFIFMNYNEKNKGI